MLLHPGLSLSTRPNEKPHDIARVEIHVLRLLQKTALANVAGPLSIYLHDSTESSCSHLDTAESCEDDSMFLGGIQEEPQGDGTFKVKSVVEYKHIENKSRNSDQNRFHSTTIVVGTSRLTVTVTSPKAGPGQEEILIILGGQIIFIASLFLARWVYMDHRRLAHLDEIQRAAASERASLQVSTAQQAAIAERQLHDFIAHEVRNPLAAALSATSFVAAAVQAEPPTPTLCSDLEARKAVREDVEVVTSSLHFINDLLRTMLDMHRARSNQIQIKKAPVDLLHDVLEPVDAMLYHRGSSQARVVVESDPKDLFVETDGLRLKQIILNLARNASKFVPADVEGCYIRLGAKVREDNGTVQIFVEDSGSGIPPEKRKNLFCRFQESLDALQQGTGVGLCLCDNLARAMDMNLWLDETFTSEVAGFRGTRFVLDLNLSPRTLDAVVQTPLEVDEPASPLTPLRNAAGITDYPSRLTGTILLPEKLNVLFVDDDSVLRKLFSRALRTCAPGWTVKEAANGETALRLAEKNDYDLIFMDMYMASTTRRLLGTEATRDLRVMGVQSRICGLSASDAEVPFLQAGADAFMFKPFPTRKDQLTIELINILGLSALRAEKER